MRLSPSAGRTRPPRLLQRRPLRIVASGVLVIGLGLLMFLRLQDAPKAAPSAPSPAVLLLNGDTVRLDPAQVTELKLGPVETRPFQARREALGMIDFDQDHAVQVFSPYQGRIGRVLVRAGDEVRKGQVLYTVQIPDLAQAASALISAAGSLQVTSQTLQRAQGLAAGQSIPQKELQQNVADQQAADGAYRAARKTLGLFGLGSTDIDEIEKSRRVDTEMPVRSPLAGRVVARSAAEGLLVQPGAGNPPVMVADMRKLWMVASVPESEFGGYHLGQKLAVTVSAYPAKRFAGSLSYIGDVADPASHRIGLRAEVSDAGHLLRPQMLAQFTIELQAASDAPAVPENALAREGDGSISAWVTKDGQSFTRRKVVTGMTQDGSVQIVDGLKAGERIAKDRALFLSNLAQMAQN
ncbi:efflux RND transporter periplasmic adaptor subunit [Roseateles saccharophilus]|uniref:Cobalt-zinc-cadmium efflux system membrane fusion protein n=2 Tax=Roseateles saccharophilus TaxID=304 RepID=A0A4R3URF5_ROSSA|nr:efflux RND transporter periplasmic adaptor subunit [Roseateles saccharophilus]TCU93270.1 cobalt-zinc-cadmium efflux system membrane fusion protein [Roseateles saccharophilus]